MQKKDHNINKYKIEFENCKVEVQKISDELKEEFYSSDRNRSGSRDRSYLSSASKLKKEGRRKNITSPGVRQGENLMNKMDNKRIGQMSYISDSTKPIEINVEKVTAPRLDSKTLLKCKKELKGLVEDKVSEFEQAFKDLHVKLD